MATPKQKALYIFLALAVLILIILAFYFFKSPDCDPYNAGFDKKGNPNSKCNIKKPNEPPPSGAPNSSWNSSESFPLNIGMYGVKTKAMQQALIDKYGQNILPKYGADGKLGNETKTALTSKGYSFPLSEVDYEKLVPKEAPADNGGTGDNGSTNGGANAGKKVYSTVVGTGIYDSPTDFTAWRLAGAGEYVGTYLGTAKDYFGTLYAKVQYASNAVKYIKYKYVSFNP